MTREQLRTWRTAGFVLLAVASAGLIGYFVSGVRDHAPTASCPGELAEARRELAVEVSALLEEIEGLHIERAQLVDRDRAYRREIAYLEDQLEECSLAYGELFAACEELRE